MPWYADAHVKDWLPPKAVKELIDFAQNNTPMERAEVDNPTLIAEEEALDHEVVIQSRVLMAKRQVPKQVSTEYWIKLQKWDAVIAVRGMDVEITCRQKDSVTVLVR